MTAKNIFYDFILCLSYLKSFKTYLLSNNLVFLKYYLLDNIEIYYTYEYIGIINVPMLKRIVLEKPFPYYILEACEAVYQIFSSVT